jgi:hypothetical protein
MSSSRSFEGQSEHKRGGAKLKQYSHPRESYEIANDVDRVRRNPRIGGTSNFVENVEETNRSFRSRSMSINSSHKKLGKTEPRKATYGRKSPQYSGEDSFDSRRSRSRDLYRGNDSSESDFKDCPMGDRGEQWACEGAK